MNLVATMKMAVYTRATDSAVVLMEMTFPGQPNEQEMKQQLDQQLEQQGRKQQITITKRETKTFTIDGKMCDFEFLTGTKAGSDKVIHQIQGVFAGRGGIAMLTVMEDDENWDEEKMVKMIESISAK